MRLAAIALLLSACVSHGRNEWSQPGRSEQEMKQDLYRCDLESRGGAPVFRGEFINRCMEAKGWR